jgi:CRP/FNR family transcriptional regulator
LRTSLAYEAGKNGPRNSGPGGDEARELLLLLEEAGFAIARGTYAPGEAMGGEERRAALYVLTSGTALLARERSAGREATLGLLKEWDVFGALWFSEDPTRCIRARAVTSCEVAKLPRPVLEAALRQDPQVALKLLSLQDAQLTRYEEFVARISPRSTLVRLSWLLLSLSESFPEGRPVVSRAVTIGLRFTHEDLAAMTVVSREAVSLAMGQLRRQGAVEANKGAITVVDRQKLRKISVGRGGRVPGVRAALVG